MTNPTFLNKLAKILNENFIQKKATVTVVLPNKRAKVFLLKALKNEINEPIFAPKIITIEDFVEEISNINLVDPIEILFEFYELYLSITELKYQQTFDVFANWAKTILNDFNEIDSYLIDPMHVLSYLKDIEDIKKWGVAVEQKTRLLENYIDFWKLLPHYYNSFYKYLLNKKIGYQGLLYREATKKIAEYIKSNNGHFFVFAGFNALNPAEEKLIQNLIDNQIANIYWDIDSNFLNDPYHDAGLFARKFKGNWKHYKSNPFEWIVNEFSQSKNIEIIGTPKSIGQAKIVGSIIDNLILTKPDATLESTAIVLGNENILIPLLYSLPSTVANLNITMGYSAKNNPAQVLLAKIFKLHCNAINRNSQSYVLYYKDVLEVLSHPLIEPFANTNQLVQIINQNNYTFFTHQKLFDLNPNPSHLFEVLFEKWNEDALEVLENFSNLLLLIKKNFNQDDENDKISKAFVYEIYKTINKLKTYFSTYPKNKSIEVLHSIYKQIIDLAEVSFEGEPLEGLQIMGVLESRVLDFETVIITSMNEGSFPAGKSQNSFIPYDVKRELGLPTYKEKDAIYTYHFYHLLQRAKNIFLIYNTENSGFDAGEKSRFITQLEIEKQPNHLINHEIFSGLIPDNAINLMRIPKSESVMIRLYEIAENGFSPSSLTSYIRNPIDFYFQKILRIKQEDEVEENVALNTLGTIIHETLKSLYEPFIGKYLSESDILSALKKLNDEVLNQFKLVYKEGEIKKGKNLLAFEVAKRNVYNFLNLELQQIKNGDAIKILSLEQRFERILENENLPFPVKIGGSVDRIEERNGKIRIIDYKTGTVTKANITLKTWGDLTKDIKNDKIIQILAYAFMYEKQVQNLPIEVGIISFKNLKSGFLPFSFKKDKEEFTTITPEIIDDYLEQIVILLNEIFDQNIDFVEKKS